MSLAGISIRRPVATTMVMLSFIFIGLLAMFSMKKELIPNINIPVVTITTTWSGAVSEDVESQVTKKIKDSLRDKSDDLKEQLDNLTESVREKSLELKGSLEEKVDRLFSKASNKSEDIISLLEKKLASLKEEAAKIKK